MEPLGADTPPKTASTHSREEPDGEIEQAAHVAAGAFEALPKELIHEGLDHMDACRQLMLSSVEGVALSQYAASIEPEAEDALSQVMNDASRQLSGGATQEMPDETPISTMVIAPLAGSSASGPGPFCLTLVRRLPPIG